MNEYCFEDIQIGKTESFQKKITVEMENSFREITGDTNPLHWDDAFAIEVGNGKFKSHVSFGMLTASFYSTLAGKYLPGKYSLIHSIDNLSFKKPVFVGDVLTVTGTVKEKYDDLKLICVSVTVTNQDEKVVSKADMKILVQK
ncbi:MAG: MaoC family dehydratase N-terminal domain-containing protein [Acetatifactor sp.]|nr:MaoC family dehydratase N-terminal domain-containing protein [Acetatifactor sp.]